MFRKLRQARKLKSYQKDLAVAKSEDIRPVSRHLEDNLRAIRNIFEDCSDIIIREFKLGAEQQIGVFLVMLDGLVDKLAVNEYLMKSLMQDARIAHSGGVLSEKNAYTLVKEFVLAVSNVKEASTIEEAVEAVMTGAAALFIEGSDLVLIAAISGFESRSVDEPDTESVVRGPREGFVEELRVNTSLLRRKIKNPNLKLEVMKLGTQTKTEICIAYMKAIANEKMVREVRDRLKRIEIDAILESGYIESLIEDAPFSPFPTVGNSEKPDIISAKILEGRVAILVDGTPFVLSVPYIFIEAFQNSEDYYSRHFYATFIRMLRWLAFGISVFLPAVYVAITTFHQELLPPALLVSIASSTEGTPFPAVVETLMMLIIYEILREGGVRLPRPIGQAVSIVGALVIGEAAVSAGLIGAPMVVVVALTAIASFVVPALADVSALLRLALLLMAGISGLFGIILGIAGILTHLCSLRSLGVPYTSPISPLTFSELKDVFIRAPWWTMLTRPRILRVVNPVRQKTGQMPKPPEK